MSLPPQNMWLVYQGLLLIGLLAYLPKALWRRRLPHRGWAMRLGTYPPAVRAALDGRPAIWVHAASVGEVMTVRPLIQRFLESGSQDPVVLSTVTPSGFHIASEWLGTRGVAIYSPLDFTVCVRRALRAIRPKMLLLVESELWPNLIWLAARQQVPVVLVNGRISERASRGYRRARRWFKPLLRSLTLLLMQSEADASRVLKLGANGSHVRVLGNLKWDACLLNRPRQAELDVLAERLGLQASEAVLVAGSTHRGEERALMEAVDALRARGRRVRLIVAPRHLERVGEVERLMRKRHLTVARMSQLLEAPQPWEAAVVDRLGQLPTFYGMATAVFVGGSLIPHGGQNPLEPASLGKPIVFGPFTHNFAEITQQLLAHQAARRLTDGEPLAPILEELLGRQESSQAMGRRAQELIEQARGATQRTWDAILPLLLPPVPAASSKDPRCPVC